MLYVGRTGDSSSQFAASPFSRLGQHLDIRPSAKANTLLRQINGHGFTFSDCKFELFSVGPIFAEQQTMDEHRLHRDIVAPLEAALAEHFKKRGHVVVGKHPKLKPHDKELLKKVISLLEDRIPGPGRAS